MKRGMCAFLFGALAGAPAAQGQESPKDVIAAHLRIQGYQCDAPRSAKRDARASRPDEQVWLISCENARYRVRLVPHMMDVVEPY
jgi:hypothetical protein